MFYCHLPSIQFDRRFLILCQNTRIDFNESFHEIFTKIGEVLAAQEKSKKLILLLNCERRVVLQCPENIVFKNLCSIRMLKGAGCEEIYTNLFETSSA